MDTRIFRILHRYDCFIAPPSPFARPETWARTAHHLWAAIRKPDMQRVWLADRGLYIKTVEAAKYCENRSN